MNKRILVLLLIALSLLTLYAYDFKVDGIYYDINSDTSTCSVTYKNTSYNSYSGNIVIPKSVIYNDTKYPVTDIGVCAFYGCSGLTSVKIPNSVTHIDGLAFDGCSGLTSVEIPNSVTEIGDYAFCDCSGLTSIEIPNSMTKIPNYAFYGCSGLTTVEIPNSVTYIGYDAFSSCSGLTFIEIPNSVAKIGSYAFSDCSNLFSLTLGTGLLSIERSAFSNTHIAKVFWLGNTPPTNYESLNASVNYVANDQYIGLSNTVKYQFLSSKFMVDGTVYVPVSPSERTCDVIDCNYSLQNGDIIISDKVINQGIELKVLNINNYSFYNNRAVTSLSANNNGNIGSYAFYNCNAINSIILGNSVTTLGESAFTGCSSLSTISIPDNVTSIGDNIFSGCSNLSSVHLGSGTSLIPTHTFSGCSALGTLSIPDNITEIKDYAFKGCSSLSNLILEDTKTEDADGTVQQTSQIKLGSNSSSPLFSDCPLDEIYIGRKLSYNTSSDYGYSPFYRNTSLKKVEITDAETTIYDNEFYGCTNLKTLKIGNGVETIGNWAFSGCSSLDYFSAGYNVESIGKEAFSDCTGLTNYYSFSINPPVCGSQALDDINKWECTLYVPAESSDEYMAADQWKDFFFINETNAVLAESIQFNAESIVGETGDTFQLIAEVLPKNTTQKSVVWSTSDPTVVTVDEEGLLTLIDVGEASITAQTIDGSGVSASVRVTVKAKQAVDPVGPGDEDGISGVGVNAEVEVYNLRGAKIADSLDRLPRGIYLVRRGSIVRKIVI